MSKCMIASPLLLLLLVLVIGCGPNHQKLTGTVTFSDDGSPLTVGVVVMQSEKGDARGTIDANGNFVMGFTSEKDGIPKGVTYKVTIVNAVEEMGRSRSGTPAMGPLIDLKYMDPNTSGFTFTSDGKTKTMDLKVDRFRQ